MRFLFLSLLLLTACAGYRNPTFSNDNAAKMSNDTLCYRYAYAKTNEALKNEVAARNLDCEQIVSELPQPGQSDY